MRKLVLFLIIGFVIAGFSFFIDSPDTASALDENNCLSCHGTEGLSKKDENGNEISLYVDEQRANIAAHRYIDCTTCHTVEPHETDTPLNKLSLAEKCGTCHQYQYKVHLESVHGQALVHGNPDVATCVDCHSNENNPHSVIRVLEYSAPTYKKNIAQTCAKCHGDEELMADYGIVEKVYESYMRSFHGKAMQLGTYELSQLDKATCTNCHGTHDIKGVNDPDSPVAGLVNLAATCETCHPGGGVALASGFLGHEEASTENVPPVYYTEILFKILLTTVLAFGAVVVVLAFYRFTVNKWRE